MYLHSFFDYWMQRKPDSEFIVQGSRQVTYGEASIIINQLANSFVKDRLQAGDRVAILSRNRIEYVLIYLAASKVGIVPVPLNFRLSLPQWAYIIKDAKARMILAEGEFTEAINQIQGELKTVKRFINFDDEKVSGWDEYGKWISGQPSTSPDVHLSENPDLNQMYTSGTTGHPKGAVITHRAVFANIMQISHALKWNAGERSLVVMPMFHAAIVPTAFTCLAWGGSLYIMGKFNPKEVVHVLNQERIVIATLVPAMIQECVEYILSEFDLNEFRCDQLRTIHYGASPIAEQTLRRALEIFRCGFVQTYGMTEATQSVSILYPEDHQRALSVQPELLQSAGRPALGTELRIVDEHDKSLPNGVVGEIVVRGPQLMRGYWNFPHATNETLRGGWLHTGDAGILDEEGYLYVRDRIKDMIISGGENVYPNVVENVISSHPAISEVAVIGVPDDKWGETVKAVVVLCEGSTATQEEIIDYCRGKLAGYERPRSVDIVDTMPRTPSGKVLKRILRKPYWPEKSMHVSET